ncbi:hypothetical protein SmJEL517_g06147 [Synchytrium microbalum]|uniref:Transcriptional repressor Tup1 N-terminal domain-containing protein n=1 Tax=Synchytrium microbalum TaxID=1806994 RepID=A0A507BY28_9FUNG|nr:uncharacterized protein SmJEL517_g06147 [Synchytrium microbalum]TPX30245.1 hypothetical protein SmJEL517_g06147 [Synchytrium microbalum]
MALKLYIWSLFLILTCLHHVIAQTASATLEPTSMPLLPTNWQNATIDPTDTSTLYNTRSLAISTGSAQLLPPQSVNALTRWAQSFAVWRDTKQYFKSAGSEEYSFWLLELLSGNLNMTVVTRINGSTILSREAKGTTVWNETVEGGDIGSHFNPMTFTLDTFYTWCQSTIKAMTTQTPYLSTQQLHGSTGLIFCCGSISLSSLAEFRKANFNGYCVANTAFYVNGTRIDASRVNLTKASRSSIKSQSPTVVRRSTMLRTSNDAQPTVFTSAVEVAPSEVVAVASPAAESPVEASGISNPSDGIPDAQVAVNRGQPAPTPLSKSDGSRFNPLNVRGPGTAPHTRIPELLDTLKAEFDALVQDHSVYKLQRDESDHKITAQMNELAAFQQSLYELERAHQKMKQLYEEEIIRLRRELEARGVPPPPSMLTQDARNRGNSTLPEGIPPPVLASSGNSGAGSVFGALMAGAGQAGPLDSQARPPYINGGGEPSHPSKRLRAEDGMPVNRDMGAAGPMNPYNPSISSYPPSVPPPSYLPQPGSMIPPNVNKLPPNKEQVGMQGPPTGNPGMNIPMGMSPGYHSPHHQQQQMQQQQQQQQQGQADLKRKQAANGIVGGGGGVPSPLPRGGTPTPIASYAPKPPVASVPMSQPVYNQPLTGLCDLSIESAQPGWKKEASDWLVLYNQSSPALQKAKMNVELLHTFDHGSTLVDDSIPKEGDLYIRSVCFSPDGHFLATGAEDRVIRVWDINQKKIRWALTGHEQDIYSLDWSGDGRVVVSGSGDRSVKVWDMETGKCTITMQNEDDRYNRPPQSAATSGIKDSGVTSVGVSPVDGYCVAAGSLDKIVRVWCLRTGTLLERFEGHRDSVYSVSFSPDGKSIVSGSLDKTIKVWDLDPRTVNYLKTEPTSNNNSSDPSQPNTSGLQRFETIVTTTCRHTYAGHRDFVLSVAFAGSTSTIGRLNERGESVSGGEGLADVEWVVSASKDRTVTFWDARTIGPGGRTPDLATAAQFVLQGHKNSVISVALAPRTGLFATGSGDWRARIWRLSLVTPEQPSIAPAAGTSEQKNNVASSSLETTQQQQPPPPPPMPPAPAPHPISSGSMSSTSTEAMETGA